MSNIFYSVLQFVGFLFIKLNTFWNKFLSEFITNRLDLDNKLGDEINKKLDNKNGNYRILSYNINYGHYLGHQHIDSIINKIRLKNIDIICLQEVPDKKTHDYIKKYSDYKYSIFHNGLSLFTNLEIDNIDIMNYSGHNFYIYPNTGLVLCKLIIDSEELYIINTHLTSDLSGLKQHDELTELVKYIETKEIKSRCIVIGDFNYLDRFDYCKIFKKINYNKCVFENSFPSIYPFMDLDKLFYKNINVKSNRVVNFNNSDHLPIYCEFDLA